MPKCDLKELRFKRTFSSAGTGISAPAERPDWGQ